MTKELQQWPNNSRWEGTKQYSKWHFDPSRPPEPGKDSYTHVCRFEADFTESVEQAMKYVKANTWADRNKFKIKDELWCASAEEQDLINAGADPKMPIFERFGKAGDIIGQFGLIAGHLGLRTVDINFHNQSTGQMLVEHIDNFAGNNDRNNSNEVVDIDRNPDIVRRFTIMLADWQLGQVFQLGNANFTQWRAGDCITWEWQDIPHATCNMGWWDRPLLQCTGRVTERTQKLLDNASPHQIIKL